MHEGHPLVVRKRRVRILQCRDGVRSTQRSIAMRCKENHARWNRRITELISPARNYASGDETATAETANGYRGAATSRAISTPWVEAIRSNTAAGTGESRSTTV